MMNIDIKRKVLTTLSTGAILLNVLTPAVFAADTTIEITGNGSSSDNTANVTNVQTTTVVQSNDAIITNTISSSATTGNNDANDNTGGDVMIDTGNAESNIEVSSRANLNKADLGDCNDCAVDSQVTISGNGSNSTNDVNLDNLNTTSVFQSNTALILNDIRTTADTGNNDANRNTGGDVTVRTGNAENDVTVKNAANANLVEISSRGSRGSVNAQITGNGSESNNSINLTHLRSVVVVQDNLADIINVISSSATTGYNDANDNTGGDVMIDTGNAKTKIKVGNLANFNSADLSCCRIDVTGKIAGNGSDSSNMITALLLNDLAIFQGGEGEGNLASLLNVLDPMADTGNNDARRNTGPVGDDPVSVKTGDIMLETELKNAANINIVGQVSGIDLPDLSGGVHLDLSFDLVDLLAFLHVMGRV